MILSKTVRTCNYLSLQEYKQINFIIYLLIHLPYNQIMTIFYLIIKIINKYLPLYG